MPFGVKLKTNVSDMPKTTLNSEKFTFYLYSQPSTLKKRFELRADFFYSKRLISPIETPV